MKLFFLLTGLLFCGFSGNVFPGEPAKKNSLVPIIEGEWWDIAANPDLGKLGKQGQEPVDFGIWQAADGTWQVWSCIRNVNCGGHERLFYRWEGKSLTDTHWTPMGIAMQSDPGVGEPEGGLQAPFVLKEKDTYYMFYGDWNRICLAKSADGKNFERVLNKRGQPDLFSGPYQNTRDAMVLKSNGLFFCYYTGHTSTPPSGQDSCAVFCRISTNLYQWSDPVVVCSGGSPSKGIAWYGADSECPFVVNYNRTFYLFRNQLYGPGGLNTQYLSDNPLSFGTGDDDSCLIGQLNVSAPEIIEYNGEYYIAALKPGLDGIRMAKLKWKANGTDSPSKAYYIDSRTGNDKHPGTRKHPWKSLEKAEKTPLQSGDTLCFARGSAFTGGMEIKASGTSGSPIVITAYGNGSAPRFTNPDSKRLNGNVFRISGSHVVVDGLYFHDCAAAANSASYTDVWDVGAVRIMLGADYCTIRNCEFVNCPKGIQSTGEYVLITGNYLHSANTRPLSFPGWGPIAIHMGNSRQEVSYNVIKDYYYIGGEFGADGGALEIDDGRNPKHDIYIHHNYTSSNMGFLEVSWFADIAPAETHDLRVAYNVSDDYQDFVMLWAPTHDTCIENNTIFRRKQVKNAIVPAVFLCDYGGNIIRNNLIVVDSITQVYTGKSEYLSTNRHTGNVYWSEDGGKPLVGIELHPSEKIAGQDAFDLK
ncbi:MAG: hypothetical protein LBH19_11755 [Dysgonamonadaceae bacterium]|jgi:hypothetical protein|nr:hypothetical protein [Dysgonamonadaceae bacterium]